MWITACNVWVAPEAQVVPQTINFLKIPWPDRHSCAYCLSRARRVRRAPQSAEGKWHPSIRFRTTLFSNGCAPRGNRCSFSTQAETVSHLRDCCTLDLLRSAIKLVR
jgi:hypothetical protein